MSIYYVFIIGIALAMDAFGVSLGVGLNPILKKRNKIKFIVSFAFFQFLFTFLGG
ncbi:Membrane protein, partial [human gut metagenome]